MTPFDLASRYVGVIKEIPGDHDHPFIQWCFSLCGMDPETHDEVAWCSAFAQHPAFELELPRSGSARARSWLNVGERVPLLEARVGYDLVVLQRGAGPQPGPEVIDAPGHVGYFAGRKEGLVMVLGGNQGDRVSVATFTPWNVLAVQRIGH